jgi:hypothetical protein
MKMTTWVAAVVGLAVAVGALIVGIVIGKAQAPAAAAPVTVVETITKTVERAAPAPTTTTASGPAQPAAEFGSGEYEVGVDVLPGKYKSSGPDGSNLAGCYWSRNTDDAAHTIIDNNVLKGPGTITIKAGELIESRGCAKWTKTAA